MIVAKEYVYCFNEARNNCEPVTIRTSQQWAMQAAFQPILSAHTQKQQLVNP
jgi:hypothetical protein